MITQTEIQRLAELKEQADEYTATAKAIKARIEAGEGEEAGGWQTNWKWKEKRSVSWKAIVERLEARGILAKGYSKNVLGNTKPSRYIEIKPAFSISAENAARKTA
jgi:hypothetical protein